jgi:hypothetical protein
LDWAWQIHQQSPLLCQGLGMDRSVNLNCGTYKVSEPSKILMVGRSHVPASFYQLSNPTLQSMSQLLIDENSDMPFWLGLMELA